MFNTEHERMCFQFAAPSDTRYKNLYKKFLDALYLYIILNCQFEFCSFHIEHFQIE